MVELLEPCLVRQVAQRDREKRIAGVPACAQPVSDVAVGQQGERVAGALVLAKQGGDLPGRDVTGGVAWLDPVDLADLAVQPGRVGTEGGDEVEGGGQHRLQDLVGQRRRLVHRLAAGHLRDGRGGRSSPGAKAGGDAVGGEQLPVVEEVDDDLGSGTPCGWAELADHNTVLVAHVAAMGHVGLAAVVIDVGEAGDAPAAEPGQETGQLDQPPVGRAEMHRRAVGARQQRHRLMPGREHGEDQFLGDQPPPGARDRGEVEAPAVKGHLHRQADYLGEVPKVIVEHRTARSAG
jgi:hypothetical protein